MTSLRRTSERRAPVVTMALAACALCASAASPSWASPLVGGDDPAGRGLQLLQARETALEKQTVQARETARRRGRTLYRLLLHEAAERRNPAPGQPSAAPTAPQAPGGRAIALGVAVLTRDLDEAAALQDELARVREERRSAVAAANLTVIEPANAAPAGPARLRAPVVGPIAVPWGVTRDEATGAWLFRTAAGYATLPGSPVGAPADGRVVRVADDGAGGRALVLVHPGGLTTVLSGLAAVAVVPREVVRAGTVVGTAGATVRLEVSRGRTPIDPASLLALSRSRGAKAAATRVPARAR
jgi:murein DD-endopeptidase MepM/ murein hydrolase activator NlpD